MHNILNYCATMVVAQECPFKNANTLQKTIIKMTFNFRFGASKKCLSVRHPAENATVFSATFLLVASLILIIIGLTGFAQQKFVKTSENND
jgi:sugar phosphate permease